MDATAPGFTQEKAEDISEGEDEPEVENTGKDVPTYEKESKTKLLQEDG